MCGQKPSRLPSFFLARAIANSGNHAVPMHASVYNPLEHRPTHKHTHEHDHGGNTRTKTKPDNNKQPNLSNEPSTKPYQSSLPGLGFAGVPAGVGIDPGCSAYLPQFCLPRKQRMSEKTIGHDNRETLSARRRFWTEFGSLTGQCIRGWVSLVDNCRVVT